MDSLTRICTSPAAHTPSIAFFFIRFPQRVDWTSGDAQPASRGSVDWTSGRAWQRLCSVPPSVTLSCQGTCPSRAAPAADIPTGVAAGRRRRSMFTAVSCCGTSRACSGWALDGRPWMAVPLLGCGTSGQLVLWCWAARRARGDVVEGRGRGTWSPGAAGHPVDTQTMYRGRALLGRGRLQGLQVEHRSRPPHSVT